MTIRLCAASSDGCYFWRRGEKIGESHLRGEEGRMLFGKLMLSKK